MTVNIGIIGLASSGRTTVFNALTGGKVDTGRYTPGGAVPHIGVVDVPDPRLKTLTAMLNPKKTVPVSVSYIDIGASVKGLVQDKGIEGQLLAQLSNVDALINVIRNFRNESIPHAEGNLDVTRDINNMNLELTFSDLALLERRLERLEVSLKGAKPPERQSLIREQELIAKLKAELEKDTPVREIPLTAEENRAISSFQLLSAKPLLIVVNIGEEELPRVESLNAELEARFSRPNRLVTALSGKLEMELGQIDDAAADELRKEFGISEPGIERVIRLSYKLMGLVSFFSTASDEVRAWSVPAGTEAVKAAGKIHTDMERGFIRAEVVSYDDLTSCDSLAEAKKKGLVRLEGKNYHVQDGDVITFLFNV